MKKRKMMLALALTTVAFSPVAFNTLENLPIEVVQAQQEESQARVALGTSLDQAAIQQTLSLLGATDLPESNILTVDGNMINSYLNDGSTTDTIVYSSAIIEPREAGYGVQVQIMTPENILSVASQTYQNAAITAGAKDVLIKISSPNPVTGEGALTGIYAIYEATGQQLSQQDISVAQKEIEVINKVQEETELTEAQINQLQINIKQAISSAFQENAELTEEEIIEMINQKIAEFEAENGVELSQNIHDELSALAVEYSQTDTAKNEDTVEQIEASTGSGWTMPQAIDFWEATFLSGMNGNLVTEENYDRSYWTEVESNDYSITLHLRNAGAGGNYYVFEKSGDLTILTLFSGNANYPDNPTTIYWIDNANFVITEEYDYFTDTLASDDATATPWNSDKAAELSAFMTVWGEGMGQIYTSYAPGAEGSMYGISFPSAAMFSLGVDGQAAPAFWSNDGVSYGEYAVVAAYSDYEYLAATDEGYSQIPHFYLFAIVGDQPVVLHSQQNQGMEDGLIHFTPTDNAELLVGFTEVIRK